MIADARTFVGEALYLSNKLATDVTAAVNRLARTSARVSPLWVKQRDWLLGYLLMRVRKGYRVIYHPRKQGQPLVPFLTVWTDSGHATTLNGRAMCGYQLRINGSLVGYRSTVTKIVALSSSGAEIFALCDGVKEGVYTYMLLAELGMDVGPIPVAVDNFFCCQICSWRHQ